MYNVILKRFLELSVSTINSLCQSVISQRALE